MKAKKETVLGIVVFSAIFFILGISVFFFSGPVATEKSIMEETEKAAAPGEVKMPSGYERFNEGDFVSDSEWVGTVIDCSNLTRIPGDSKECNIYKMHLYEADSYKTFTIEPVLEMDGKPSSVPYDGYLYG